MAGVIKYTNKAFLREHIYGNPIDNPTPIQTHAFIFPGDEIVMYHKISLPDDALVDAMSRINFVSAKTSIIAQKPNIFSEEFSRVFQATRSFELDSFVTSFNNLNARIIPWGSDGYAPNLTVKQDRNFKLPSGDFRREVNFFTKHDSPAVWDYWFYFPILWRWEYWIALLTVDNDFYDASQPQDGLNNWWYHYFVNGIWTLKSRLDLTLLVDGVTTVIRSELDLTPSIGDVNDYNSNPDWDDEYLETSKVGGTLSSSPLFIYGQENTVVVSGFTKTSATDFNTIDAIVWIEPYEGAGSPVRTRGSSVWDITPESVFMGLNTSPTDDDGIGILTPSGDYVVYDPQGKGALCLYDLGASTDVTVVAIIDYNKLNTIYPGIKQFGIKSRIYNNS